MNKARLIEKIAELVKEKKLEGITVDRSAGDLWGKDDEPAPKAATRLSVWIAAAALLLILAEWGLSCREEL